MAPFILFIDNPSFIFYDFLDGTHIVCSLAKTNVYVQCIELPFA